MKATTATAIAPKSMRTLVWWSIFLPFFFFFFLGLAEEDEDASEEEEEEAASGTAEGTSGSDIFGELSGISSLMTELYPGPVGTKPIYPPLKKTNPTKKELADATIYSA